MKHMLACFAVAAAAVGCNTGTPGGATNPDNKKPIIGEAEGKFHLTVPTLGTTLQQGESKNVTIGIGRGKNFDEDVTLSFEGLPEGVTIDPPSPTIKHGEENVKVSIKASDSAAVGDFTIKMTGKPTKGAPAHNDLKLTVKKK